MSDAIPQATPQPLANLDALHRQLEEMVTRTKEPGTERNQRQEVEGPVLVIRGK
jgi:hypothetical protein